MPAAGGDTKMRGVIFKMALNTSAIEKKRGYVLQPEYFHLEGQPLCSAF